MEDRVDVLIAGAGFAGLSLAVALKQALGPSFSVAVADPALARTSPAGPDPRAYAVAAASRRLLAGIGAWDAAAAQPVSGMTVTDSRLADTVRPDLLHFDGAVAPDEPFAHMVESAPLMGTLLDRARAEGVALHSAAIADFSTAPARLRARLADGGTVAARLLVAADGPRSSIRERAGIATVSWDYPQAAIVATVTHGRDHEGRAVQHFLPAGPFAMLPLTGRRMSIVWTEAAAEAKRIAALDDAGFHAELEPRFGLELGEIAAQGPRAVYPLRFLMARSFVSDRIALLGDAGHVIHPLAGQGMNMGLRDVAALAEVLADSARLGLDPGGGAALARYQRWRRFDNLAMGIATDGLNRLFSNHSDLARSLRDLGLGMVERMPSLKELFIREAAGLTGEVPRLLRGEAL